MTAADLTQHHPLKAYDAVQLAVALRYGLVLAGHPFTFVSGDDTLLAAARAEVLSAENPFDHVSPEDRQDIPGDKEDDRHVSRRSSGEPYPPGQAGIATYSRLAS